MQDYSAKIQALLSEEARLFLLENGHLSPAEIALSSPKISGLSPADLADQALARQKAKGKLPQFLAQKKLIFPPPLSVEQASAEAVANARAALFLPKQTENYRVFDLTGGMGADSLAFAQAGASVVYHEPEPWLFALTQHNFSQFSNIQVSGKNTTAEEALSAYLDDAADLLYLDPSRRKEGQKVVALSDCVPNVVALKNELLRVAPRVLLKLSPVLDEAAALRELGEAVSEVHFMGYRQECKELLLVLSREAQPLRRVVHWVRASGAVQSLEIEELKNPISSVSTPAAFLFRPHAAMRKARAGQFLAQHFGLESLNASGTLLTGNVPLEDFPGRTLRIEKVQPYQKKKILREYKKTKFNVLAVGTHEKASAWEAKLQLSPSAEGLYLVFWQNAAKKTEVIEAREIL